MVKEVFNGIQDYFTAYRLLNELNLWKYFKIPIVISFLLGITVILLPGVFRMISVASSQALGDFPGENKPSLLSVILLVV
ncbi:hypothetical protein [Kordia sp.]|uniref:hypothetical protein n=1 Tax=Kordia sp. TaxID=1965332 RepID=UPI0025BD51E7|nr:hypothetical protein [Kordia sp.]MCH2195681.1 hypothetical protein [Kordia sp.]